MTLERDLADVLNRHCQEAGSNTPDFILAQYLLSCLAAFNAAVARRDVWYGREAPTSVSPPLWPDPLGDG